MSALKLFISHSSRLDDVEHKYTSQDRNWRLLEDTCKAIRHKYGDRVEVLVDKDGLIPGEDWHHRLNLWLAECHVAIILFSKRATESKWVANEAAILSWRAELDKGLTLIPVMLKGESTCEDLVSGFLGILRIEKRQCIRDAENAEDILAGVVRSLGEPEELPGEYPTTPLEVLQGGIAQLLSDQTTKASLLDALDAVGCPRPSPLPSDNRGFADLLGRHFLLASAQSVSSCFRTFKEALSRLTPEPARERAHELFKYIRSFWVEPADVGRLRLAKQLGYPLALTGQLVSWNDHNLGASCYTLERFIERAWPGPESDQFLAVSLTEPKPSAEVQEEIRRRFLGGGPLPPGPKPEETQDRAVNRDGRTIVLLILAHGDKGGLPDPAFIQDLIGLHGIYDRLILVFDVGTERPALPAPIKTAQPRLDEPDALRTFLVCESDAFYDERTTKTFLDQKYGNSQ